MRLLGRPCVTNGLASRGYGWQEACVGLSGLWETHGGVDLLLAAATALHGSPSEVLHLLVHADLSQRSDDFGLSVDRIATSSHTPV